GPGGQGPRPSGPPGGGADRPGVGEGVAERLSRYGGVSRNRKTVPLSLWVATCRPSAAAVSRVTPPGSETERTTRPVLASHTSRRTSSSRLLTTAEIDRPPGKKTASRSRGGAGR